MRIFEQSASNDCFYLPGETRLWGLALSTFFCILEIFTICVCYFCFKRAKVDVKGVKQVDTQRETARMQCADECMDVGGHMLVGPGPSRQDLRPGEMNFMVAWGPLGGE